jgi:ribosomal protein L40E
MLVNVIGNASQTQLDTPREETLSAPVLREKVFGLPVDREILFTNDRNVYQASIEKRQRRWFVKLSFLKSFLLSGERILRIATARSPLCWYEQLLTGGVFLGLERAFLVFTSYRILHIPTDSAYVYRKSIAQVRYRDIRSIHMRWRTLIIAYKNGKTERFGGIAFRERKKIKQLLTALPLMKQVLQPVGRRHLCPRCAAVLSERTMRCRRCELSFKSKRVAGLMALLFPGGGYFYSRLFFPWAIFFVLEALLLSMLVAVGASLVPVGTDRSFLLGGLILVWAGIKAAGWIHAGHFFKQYIPRKSRLDRWSPPMAGAKMRY